MVKPEKYEFIATIDQSVFSFISFTYTGPGLRWTIFSWFALEQWIIRFYASGNSIMSLDCTDKNVRELHELIDYVTKVETNWSRNFGFNLNQSIHVNKWFCYRWLEHRALHCVTIYLIDKFGTRELFSVARSLNSIVHKQSFSNNEAFFCCCCCFGFSNPMATMWQLRLFTIILAIGMWNLEYFSKCMLNSILWCILII